jgi:sensor c-di-GMP phosphodiesterase-like protein
MRILVQRALLTATATVFAAGCGTLAGFLGGHALTLSHVQARLLPYATRILTEAEASAGEARAKLAILNSSSYPYCSDREIAWIRKLIFQSEYLKEGGHVRDNRIDCSAMLGRLDAAKVEARPDFSLYDGIRLYRDLAPFQIIGQTVVTIQLGNSYVVYNPYNRKDLENATMHFTVTELDSAKQPTGRLLGEPLTAPVWILTQDGQTRVGDRMFATRCSVKYSSCITAYISVPEALRVNRGEFTAYIVMGASSGAIFGFLCSIVYRRSRGMEQQLRRAIRRDKLCLVYQPIVEVASRRIVGAEALARWTDEDKRAVGPDVFVRLAEQRGFVGAITELVLRHAVRDFAVTLRGHPGFRLSVNAAAADLNDPAFLPMLQRTIEAGRVSARSLGIEITESSTALHEVAKETIRRLRATGHAVHIDDFGTGYSSLSYLHDLSIDAIKIDRAFTRAIGTEAITVSILPQILAMAKALEIEVIVEGIETAQQADYFAACGQRIQAQGWFFGRPVPADEFRHLLAEAERKELVSNASH